MQLVILLVELAGALALAGVLIAVRVRADRLALRRRVVVNLMDGTAFDAILWARRGRLLVLKDAMRHEQGLAPVPLDGEVLLDRSVIDFVQVRPGVGA